MDDLDVDKINMKGAELLSELYNSEELGFDRTSKLLAELRILTREKSLNTQVLNLDCIKLLVDQSCNCQIEAQMCLSNLILNYPHLRDLLIDPYISCAETRFSSMIGGNLKVNNPIAASERKYEVLYYDLTIISLLSALCPNKCDQIRSHLLDLILDLIEKESNNYSSSNHPMIVESLKTLFNLTLGWTLQSPIATRIIRSLFEIVETEREITESEQGIKLCATKQLLVNLIHLLTNMPKDVYLQLSYEDVDKILIHMDNQLKNFSSQKNNSSSLRESVLPVLNVCVNICKYNEEVRLRWFDKVINSEKNFDKRPEECDTLRGRIVKLMTSVDVHVKDLAARYMFALCGEDTEKFITYTGFGNSAAFLASRGLISSGTRNSIDNHQNVGESGYRDLSKKIDPITGRLETPKKNPMEGLSEEEKEYHAHELADAITKLTNLGVVKPLTINQDGNIADFQPNTNDVKDM